MMESAHAHTDKKPPNVQWSSPPGKAQALLCVANADQVTQSLTRRWLYCIRRRRPSLNCVAAPHTVIRTAPHITNVSRDKSNILYRTAHYQRRWWSRVMQTRTRSHQTCGGRHNPAKPKHSFASQAHTKSRYHSLSAGFIVVAAADRRITAWQKHTQ